MFNKDGLESDKKIKNEDLAKLIASDLWKKEDKKEKKWRVSIRSILIHKVKYHIIFILQIFIILVNIF